MAKFHVITKEWSLPHLDPDSRYLLPIDPLIERVASKKSTTLDFDEICYREQAMSPSRYAACDTTYPCIVLRDVYNPCDKKYRLVDGNHRMHKMIAEGKSHSDFYVFEYREVEDLIKAYGDYFEEGSESDRHPSIINTAGAAPDAGEDLAQAKQYHYAGRLEEAEHIYRELLLREPDNADARHLMGVMAHQRGQYDVAIARIDEALATRPNFVEAHNNRGASLKALQRYDEAELAFRAAVALDNDFADAHYNLASVLQASGKLDDAIAANRSAIAIEPDSAEFHINLGAVLIESGDTEDAVDVLRHATALDADSPEAHYNLGVALSYSKLHEDAATSFSRSIELRPDRPDAHFRLGAELIELQCFDAAIAAFDRACEGRPNFAAAHCQRARAWLGRNEPAAALASLEASLEIAPGYAEAIAYRTLALRRVGNRRAADSLMDVERFVKTTRIIAPSGFHTVDDLNHALKLHLREPPASPGADMFSATYGVTASLQPVLRAAVEDYLGSLPADPTHLFLGCLPRRWTIAGRGLLLNDRGDARVTGSVSYFGNGAVDGIYWVESDASAHHPYLELGSEQTTPLRITLVAGEIVLFPSYFFRRIVSQEPHGAGAYVAISAVREE